MKNIKFKAKKLGKRALHFLWGHKGTMIQLAIMAGLVLASSDFNVVHASTASGTYGGEKNMESFNSLLKPLESVQMLMTGPIPKVVGAAGIGILGLSTAMSFESQVSKRAVQLAGGAAAAMGGASLITVAGSGACFF